jgi:hypothetical protein
MAIYSLSHNPIGKSTQRDPYTASAHIAYITRARALQQLEACRMPDNGEDAAAWLKQAEDRDRKNARVVDKIMLALPRELSPEQRVELVRAFAEELTQGKASWLAAFHENEVDANNPHCHLVIRDRDPKTGKRVIGTSEKGSTEKIRKAWEMQANDALLVAGKQQRIDRRTLEAQGLKRRATIHEGVRARRMRSDGRNPRSRPRRYRNGAGAKRRMREVQYPRIDNGRSRHDYNRQIVARHETEADYWMALDADRQGSELQALRAIHRPVDADTARERYRRHLAEFQASQREQDPARKPKDSDQEWEPDD